MKRCDVPAIREGEAEPSSTSSDLANLRRRKLNHFLPIEFSQGCEDDTANGEVQSEVYGIRADEDVKVTLLHAGVKRIAFSLPYSEWQTAIHNIHSRVWIFGFDLLLQLENIVSRKHDQAVSSCEPSQILNGMVFDTQRHHSLMFDDFKSL
eukprot:CAMPEP_0201536224 /NCGR_PEP_ID=MMETSP0161_2-20130828/61270_1 /ASSEMBLY_ACC=CAM_ASM_000251 /TAXON_ID=180227 /ORGANISM="Neoparamoeba aestuarina, Strain SoJaBio B1-5/56/2" /LENGTH=150 /DNA_ID=CAMNT_0047941813 /DNA_START=381 /DNA_END=830 /DNA_ORIENTATION=+